MRLIQLTFLLVCWRENSFINAVRIIETNSFRSERPSGYLPSDNYRQQKLVEASSEPKYVDSSEIRYDENPGPFFPIQFPSPIQYDQSNAIRYQVIERDKIETQFDLGSIDIGEAETEAGELEGELMPPLISTDRDIEIYQNPGLKPYSGESIELDMFDLPEDVFYYDSSPGENHPGSINFSPEPEPLAARTPLTQYVESNLLRKHKTTSKPTQFGVMISSEEGSSDLKCSDRERSILINSLKEILTNEMKETDFLREKAGISIDLSIADECGGPGEREAIAETYILLTNSEQVVEQSKHSQAILNVSSAHQMSQFEKALSKVGITAYHHLTLEELYSNANIINVLRTKDIDTVISDVHGKDLEMLIDKLSGVPEEASQYTWIFTSILSSEMLLKIEQLLTRTKVVSIFATQNKKLLHAAVQVKDNASQISAMETSLPYLYMLRQLHQAYLEAWRDLCQEERGKCSRLSALEPRQFINNYFNPSIKARRKTPVSFMLIVYRSSAVEDFLDLEIPTERSSTVSVVMSTVEEDTVVPSVVITQTVSTINLTEASSQTVGTTTEHAVTQEEEEEPTTIRTITEAGQKQEEIVERCRKYNACVVYLLQHTDNTDQSDLTDLLDLEAGSRRRSGLTVGTAVIPMDQLYEVALPRNAIATVTLNHKESSRQVFPELYHLDLSRLALAADSDLAMVESVARVLSSLVGELGWERVVVVVQSSSGVTSLLTDSLVRSLCVSAVLVLPLQSSPQSPAWQALKSLYSRAEAPRLVVLGQTPDQLTSLLVSLTDLVGWDTVRRGQYLAWSYIQTDHLLAHLAEQLIGLDLHLVADSEEESSVSRDRVAGRMMVTLGESLSDYSARHCPDTQTILTCVNKYRAHLAAHGEQELQLINGLDYNILRLNSLDTEDSEEPLYILAGAWSGGRLVMYEETEGGKTSGQAGAQCLNTSQDYSAQLLSSLRTGSNIKTLWGSIALGICIFGVLIVVISAFYFIIALNRKQKTEYGSSKDNSRLLHYMLIMGLILLFLCPVPFVIDVNQYTCILRHSVPTLAFSTVLASLLVNLIATFRQTIYTVTPAQVSHCMCSRTLDSPRGLVMVAVMLTMVQVLVSAVDLSLYPPVPDLTSVKTCQPGHDSWHWSLVVFSWLLLLTFVSVCMCVACLKYDATNRDAKWSLVCLISLTTIWVSWLVLTRLLEDKFQDPVCVMALVVSAILVLLCLYARKLYEFTEFGKADTKLELMSNIMLSDSPTDSQTVSRTFGSSMSILPGIIAMPEEDNSILGDSVYQHLRYEERESNNQPVDLKMFEQHQQETYGQHQAVDLESLNQSEYGDWSREDIYQSISRGVGYKPVLKKIGSRHMLVLNNQQTLSRGSTSKI